MGILFTNNVRIHFDIMKSDVQCPGEKLLQPLEQVSHPIIIYYYLTLSVTLTM
jgi:hypothetical protein